jgi:ABC-type branched-subunit amino acid transport system permease subunit
MSVGAYASAIVTTQLLPESPMLFPLAMIAGGLTAALFGYLIGIPASGSGAITGDHHAGLRRKSSGADQPPLSPGRAAAKR